MVNVDHENIPAHIAIIMDGNGRWAKKRSLSRTQGHVEGVRRVEEIVDAAQEFGVKILTLYTFSTENWKRPKAEVLMLMNLLAEVLKRKMDKLIQNNIKFQIIGKEDRIPDSVLKIIKSAVEKTKGNTGLVVNLAFNYGSRLEIVDAVKSIALNVQEGRLTVDDIGEETIGGHLYTKNLPDPDLLIRTSGEKRISNFLLWQLSYAELYFTEKFWPEFDKNEFWEAIENYRNRERRYGI